MGTEFQCGKMIKFKNDGEMKGLNAAELYT